MVRLYNPYHEYHDPEKKSFDLLFEPELMSAIERHPNSMSYSDILWNLRLKYTRKYTLVRRDRK